MKHVRKLLAVLLACCLTVPTVKTVYAEETAEETIQTEKPVQSEIAETTGKENTTEETKEEKEDVTEEAAESGGTASDEKQEASEEPTGEIKPEEKAEAQSRELTGSAEATVAMQNDGSAVAEVDGQSYPSLQEAVDAAAGGQTVKVTADVDLTQTVVVEGKKLTLDLNGKKLYNSKDIWEGRPNDWSLVSVRENGDLTITGEGTLATKENDCYGVDLQDVTAKCTIESGTYIGNIHAVYVQSGALTVKGGNYSIQQLYPNASLSYEFVLNCYDANHANGTATITVSGGTFEKFNPGNNNAEGKGNSFLAEGYKAVQNGDSYEVVELKVAEINGTIYSSLLKAMEAAKSGDTIKMLEDEDLTEILTVDASKKVTLDLAGHTVKTLESTDKDTLIVKGELTIKDTVGSGKLQSKCAIEANGAAAKITVESSIIEVTGEYGFYAKEGGTVVINGGNITSYYAALSGNNTTGDMNFTVNGGTLTAKYGPAIYMPGPVSLNVTGGTLNGGISLRMGKVRISGGTINAITEKIDSPTEYYHYSGNAWLPDALYVFGGTYTSGTGNNALDLEITGGTLNCANGQGSAVAIYDLGAVEQSMTVKISGDAGLSTNATGREAYQVLGKAEVDPNNENKHYANFWKDSYTGNVDSQLSGGYYSHEAEKKYIVSGKVCSKGSYAVNGRIYSYTIGAPEKAVVVTVPGTNVGTVSDKVTDNDKAMAATIANQVELAGDAALTAAAAPIRDNLASKDSTVRTSKAALEKQYNITLANDAEITTSVEPYLETTVTGITKTDTEKRIELDIKMYYNIKATAVDSTHGKMTATVAEKQLMPDTNVIGKELKISVKIPKGIFSETDAIFVKHTKEDGSVYNHEATLTTAATGEAEDTLTFVNKYGFSSFVIGTDTRSATVKYEDGTAAGTTVSYGPGDVGIKELPAGPAKSGYTFKGWSLVTPGGTVLGTHSGKLTDALLTRLAEVTGTIIAKPVYEEIKSNTDTTTGSSNSGSTKKHHSSGSSKTATTVKAAKTGDESNIWLPAGMLAVAVLGLGCCMVYRKKKREKAE